MLHRGAGRRTKENHGCPAGARSVSARSGATPTKGVTWVALTTERAWTYGSAWLLRAKLSAASAKGNEAALRAVTGDASWRRASTGGSSGRTKSLKSAIDVVRRLERRARLEQLARDLQRREHDGAVRLDHGAARHAPRESPGRGSCATACACSGGVSLRIAYSSLRIVTRDGVSSLRVTARLR